MKIIYPIVLSLALGLVATSAEAAPAKVEVRAAQGTVSLERDGDVIPVKKGAKLQANDFVKTGEDGLVDIVWARMWGYRLRGNSECILSKADKNDTKIHMRDGELIGNVEELPPNALFEVSTPTAIMSVRGTKFWVRVTTTDKEVISTFAVSEGFVEVNAPGEAPITLSTGQAVDVREDLDSIQTRTATLKEMKSLKQANQLL